MKPPFDESLPRHHLNCTYMMPVFAKREYPPGSPIWLTDATHRCWCSAWRQLKSGEYRVWRRGAWRKPKPGEVRRSRRGP